eukprot:307812_1
MFDKKTCDHITWCIIGIACSTVILFVSLGQFSLNAHINKICTNNDSSSSKSSIANLNNQSACTSESESSLYNVAIINTEQSEYQYFHIRNKFQKHFLNENEQFKHWLLFSALFIGDDSGGELFIGDDSGGDVPDGGKWCCGIHLIKDPCIVYSFGSSNNFAFEYGILNLLPQCNIYTFDPFKIGPLKYGYNILDEYKDRITYQWWGISGIDNPDKNMYTLPTIMKMLNHSHIDVLKIDVEGAEFEAFNYLKKSNDTFPSIGQLQIELHMKSYNNLERRMDVLTELFDMLESHNLRIFHREAHTENSAEFALIQKNWKPHLKLYK